MTVVKDLRRRASFTPWVAGLTRCAFGTLALTLGAAAFAPNCAADAQTIAIVIHGGAGVINRAEMSAEREARYRAGLEAARDAGYAVLERGGSSLDAVTAAVRALEDDPLFNAGKGAVLNRVGVAELDSSIMDGKTLRAGAVAGVQHVKNPIDLARAVMEKSPHVMLAGTGAEEFALEQGFTLVPNSYFRTEARIRQLERAQQEEKAAQKTSASNALPGRAPSYGRTSYANPHALSRSAEHPVANLGPNTEAFADTKGTVGAVALDRHGNLAAATSTGGMTNKRPGRIGDSPIIGAGTYANNTSCAVSATGDGEFFIRSVVAHDICALVEYKRIPLEAAARQVIHEKIDALRATGGVIALDTEGNIVMDFNSNGMFRASRDSRGRRDVAIYGDR
jgi:beta-aspartyl-peptidase (threonine type)